MENLQPPLLALILESRKGWEEEMEENALWILERRLPKRTPPPKVVGLRNSKEALECTPEAQQEVVPEFVTTRRRRNPWNGGEIQEGMEVCSHAIGGWLWLKECEAKDRTNAGG